MTKRIKCPVHGKFIPKVGDYKGLEAFWCPDCQDYIYRNPNGVKMRKVNFPVIVMKNGWMAVFQRPNFFDIKDHIAQGLLVLEGDIFYKVGLKAEIYPKTLLARLYCDGFIIGVSPIKRYEDSISYRPSDS